MKVLVVNTVPFGMNGISTVVMNFHRVCKNKISMDYIINDYIVDSYKNELLESDANMFFVNRKRGVIAYVISLFKILRNGKYDAIHVHGNSATMAIETCIAKICGVKKRIVHSHNTQCTHILAHKILVPFLCKTYTKAIACSKEAGEWIFGSDFNIVENGIVSGRYLFHDCIRQKVRNALGVSKGSMVIGHIGLINEQKNHKKLIRVFKEIKNMEENVHLLCIAGGSEIPLEVKNLILSLELTKDITFLFNRDDINDLLQSMDVFIFPSRWEGFGISVIEAEASGLPCLVSSAVPKSVDLLRDICHLSLDKSDREWAEKAIEMAKNKNQHQRKLDNITVSNSRYNIDNNKTTILNVYLND